MSETDDTDDLLLIPPDFFVIDSDTDKDYGPCYSVVDSLITQVSNLEDRISFIEYNSDVSVISSSLDSYLECSNNMQNSAPLYHKFHSSEDISRSPKKMTSESTQSTPLKPRTKYKLNSLPASPQLNRFSQNKNNTKTPTKYSALPTKNLTPGRDSKSSSGGDTLIERDNFISTVKTIKRMNTVRSLENEFSNMSEANSSKNKKLDIDDIDKMLNDMEMQQKEIELRIVEKEKELFNKEPVAIKEKTWQQGDDINTIPDYNFGIRNLLHNNNVDNLRKQGEGEIPVVSSGTERNNNNDMYRHSRGQAIESSVQRDNHCSSESTIHHHEDSLTVHERFSSDSSTDTTQMTAYNIYEDNIRTNFKNTDVDKRAVNAINLHRESLRNLEFEASQANKNKKRHFQQLSSPSNNLSMVSLADLWSSRSHGTNPSQYAQKLQEEKLRRKHCEELIHQLQNRVLELQEKLAVAVQVDEAKDNAILKIHNAWENAVTKIKFVNKEKCQLEEEIERIKSKQLSSLEGIHQKITHYENEASKALNLAHTSQEKLSQMEQHCADLEKELLNVNAKLSEVQKNHANEIDKNKSLLEIIAKKELELEEGKTVLMGARKEIAESKRAVEVCQAEFSSMKTEYNNLELVLKEKENRILELDKQKRKLVEEVEAHKNITKNLQEELNKTREQMDNNKIELKNFYQNQVEMLVQNKLKDFQNQLDEAETLLKEELKRRELAIAKTAAAHIQQISEKYSIEIKLLEEKHKEEVKLYQVKLSQYQQQIEEFEVKFQHQQVKRDQIADQLRKVMEAQWMEALRIISNSRSPMTQQDCGFNPIDQLNSLKSRSYTNLEEVLSNMGEVPKGANMNSRKRSSKTDVNADSYCSLIDDNREGNAQLSHNTHEETPVTSRDQRKHHSDIELQKYIQMLLNKQPGNPTASNEDQHFSPENTGNDRVNWQALPQNQYKQSGDNKNEQRNRRGKPPWK